MSDRAFIVCVDDEQSVLNQLSAQLTRRFGSTHLVECAESAEEALAIIEETFASGDRVELVVCDQVMPGLKGDRFLEAVQKGHPEIMRVLLTGQAGLDSAIYAINNAGLHRYIEKPWEAEDLNLSIQSLLTQYHLSRELLRHRERLERRSAELSALHLVGRELASTVEASTILSLAVDAARSVAGTKDVVAVALAGTGETARWAGLPHETLGQEARCAIEQHIAQLRARSLVAIQGPWPDSLSAYALHQGDLLFGWLFVPRTSTADPDAGGLLAILAGQASASLNRVRLIEERLASERLSAIGRMISALAHDLRNPMTAIKGYAGMFEEFELPRDRQRECARLIVEESDRMSAMIEEVLDFSRGEKSRLRLAPIDVSDLLDMVQRLVEPAFSAKGVALRKELGYLGPIVVDADRLRRAILNIASNALDATDRGGSLTFSTRVLGTTVELSLEDNGHGIPPEVQQRVFEPFFTYGKTRGVGLGMAIARRIVEEHGGSISLESRVGAGTRFTLKLPLAAAVTREADPAWQLGLK